MAFDLRPNNLSGLSIITQPAGVIAGADNFIDLYTYAQQYCPELVPQLYMRNGMGSIRGFLEIVGQESTYSSDKIQHSEIGRLQNLLSNVAVSGTTFTSPIDHNLAAGDTIKVSDGAVERQATVDSITSATVFEASSDDGAAFPAFAGGVVSVIGDFSNSYEKGSADSTKYTNWSPDVFENYTHILKRPYKVSQSDMAHKIWIETPFGPKWFNLEVQRTSTLFDNLVEGTQIFHERKSAGNARGVVGVVPTVEQRGNVGNELIDDIESVSQLAFRAKQQGGCREFMAFSRHDQMAALRRMQGSVNAHYAGGAYYGMFDNSKEMALQLGFNSIYVDGITLHATDWKLLDDPTYMGDEKFITSGVAALIVPAGELSVTENGESVMKPYLSYRYRTGGGGNFKKETKVFGPNGTPHKEDTEITHFKSEFTNQLAGANEFTVVRGAAGYYA